MRVLPTAMSKSSRWMPPYDVAPGWDLTGALHFGEAENMDGTAVPVKNDGTALIFTNIFKF